MRIRGTRKSWLEGDRVPPPRSPADSAWAQREDRRKTRAGGEGEAEPDEE